jgi:hypothetical protein
MIMKRELKCWKGMKKNEEAEFSYEVMFISGSINKHHLMRKMRRG